ncbi:MAG TPA: hypothetical protein VFR47_14920 [Anaerolineales bacterium]|nr:hypothetical protein [Anaerolineales bacterium]
MRQPTFRQLLLKHVAPPLKTFGFQYDESLKVGSARYGFKKHLVDDIEASILFQRTQYSDSDTPYGYGFTVELSRHRVDPSGQRHYRQYDGGFSMRLPRLIVDAYGLRLYSEPDYWWHASTSHEFKTALDDVISKLERYGIACLESQQFRYWISGGNQDEWNALQNMLDKIVLPSLSAVGYESEDDPIQFGNTERVRPQRHFKKPMQDDSYAFISFHPFADFHTPKENATGLQKRWLGVMIARKHSYDLNAETTSPDSVSFQGWLGPTSFSRSDVREMISETALWKYLAAALPLQLSVVVEKIKRDAIPILEEG